MTIVQSTKDSEFVSATFNPNDLIGRTFLMHPSADGERLRAKIVEALTVHDDKLQDNGDRIQFRVKVGDEGFEKRKNKDAKISNEGYLPISNRLKDRW